MVILKPAPKVEQTGGAFSSAFSRAFDIGGEIRKQAAAKLLNEKPKPGVFEDKVEGIQ